MIWCLTHNAYLAKILSFCKVLDLRKTHLEEMFHHYFHITSTIVFSAWPSKIKTMILFQKLVCTSSEKISKTYVRNVNKICRNLSKLCEWGIIWGIYYLGTNYELFLSSFQVMNWLFCLVLRLWLERWLTSD
jgi:hypothetical protein